MIRAILNLRAGVAARRAREALEEARRLWPDLEVTATEGPGHAEPLAREAVARGDTRLLVAGGDGTVNEAAAALLGTGVALGVVPTGSGNGLARTLGIPLRPRRALEALARAETRRMDVGTANGRPFLNVAGAGFDAVVGAEFQRHGRRGGRRGVLTYVRLAFGVLSHYRSGRWSLAADEHRFEGRAFLVAFGNGRQYGGGAVIAPGARLDDGLLDIVLVEERTVAGIALNAHRLYTGTLTRWSGYRHLAAASALLTGDGPFPFHRDGEPDGPTDRLEIALRPRALSVLVPAAAAGRSGGPFRP